ncbi:MAG: AAA family ATPase [Actinobacteria bacterium]|nr:AAA family ATPase [Actinomycetota bacterium]
MTAHAKVTTIAHTASGMGQVWYRVTGTTGVANRQVAYRAGVGAEDVRRVRFVGGGATAQLLSFRPDELVRSAADLVTIEEAFSGSHLTHGVKTQRSRLARVPAEPIRALVLSALTAHVIDVADAEAAVFTSRDARDWWRTVDRSGARDRSVSFLTAAGALRVLERRGMGVTSDELHRALGSYLRAASEAPVPVGSRRPQPAMDLFTSPDGIGDLTDVELGEQVWCELAAAASRREPVGNAGYELTLTLPKSFSVYALSGPESLSGEWLDVMETAATRALERLMAEAGFCSTGHRGDGQDVQVMPADGWAGFIATEISSRAGDPHLHVHCTLPNQLVGRDGLVRTMADGGRELVINAPRFAAWGQAFVIDEAMQRGLIPGAWFNVATRQWEVGGFSDNTLAAFSRAHWAVITELGQDGDDQPRDARGIARRDRAAKSRATGAKAVAQPTWGQLREAIVARASHLWFDLDAERADVNAPVPQPGEWTDDEWVGFVTGAVCEYESTASLARIRALVDLAGCRLPDEERLRITRLVVDQGFVRGHESHDTGMRSGGQRWVSRAALSAEERLMAVFADGLNADPVKWSYRTAVGINRAQAANGWRASDEQVDAVIAIVDGRDRITLVSGVAGSGKTTVLAAAHTALSTDRRPGVGGILVTSTATLAASTAGDASGAPWMNVSELIARIDAGQAIKGTVVVVDEASMVDVKSLARIADWCAASHKRLVLQGDDRQLRAVGAGDAFNVLCAAHPERVVRLTENRRQRTESGRQIARALHARDVDTAWTALLDDDAVLVARNREHKLDAVAATVVDAIAEHGPRQVTCDAVTNVEVDDLNARIHARLVADGHVDASTVTRYRTRTGDRELGAGTVLRVVTPMKASGRGDGLVRGERVSVTEAGRDRIQIAFDDGRTRSLTPRTLFAHLDYGYAGTTHKVQGQTSAVHVASLDRNKDLASLYVSATRGRDRTVFVADAREWLTDSELSKSVQWPPGQLDDEVLDRVARHLVGRPERVDSPTRAMAPHWEPPHQAMSSGGMGMSW